MASQLQTTNACLSDNSAYLIALMCTHAMQTSEKDANETRIINDSCFPFSATNFFVCSTFVENADGLYLNDLIVTLLAFAADV